MIENLKEKEITISHVGNHENDTIKDLGITRMSDSQWRKEFRDYELKRYFKLKNSTITDLKHENIRLQEMIDDAKEEQVLLKEAIHDLFRV